MHTVAAENRSSWSLGRFFGIQVYIHWTFLLLLAYVVLQVQDVVRIALVLLFVAAVFACIVLHEFGHALTARHFKIRTKDIVLLPICGLTRLERTPDDPLQELWVAIAGPAVNLGIALLLAAWLLTMERMAPGALLDPATPSFPARLLSVNLYLVLLNLVPAFPMDGGRVLRALLAMRMRYFTATRIASYLGQTLAVLFMLYVLGGLLKLYSGPLINGFSLIVGLFVFFGAQEEIHSAGLRALFKGIYVRDVMVEGYRGLDILQPVEEALELLADEEHEDFLAMEGSRILGLLTRDRIVAALASGKPNLLVQDIMLKNIPALEADDPLESGFLKMRELQCPSFPVVREGKLIGMLFLRPISEQLLKGMEPLNHPAPAAPGRAS